MTNSVRVGVVGTGHWGRNLLRNFDALGALAALYDIDPRVREEVASHHPKAHIYASHDELFVADDIDAVVIATPPATHGEIARRALDAGKHVFVEKPLCLNVEEAEELYKRALTLDRTLMVGHLLLYHPAFHAVQGLVAEGQLGELRYIYSHRLSLGQIRREESALWSFAPHDISMILALTGSMPERVVATGGYYLVDGVADTTLSHLIFPGGVQAHIFVSWLHPYKDHRLVVVGERAMIVFDDVLSGPDKVLLYPHRTGWHGEIPIVDKAEAEPVPYTDLEPLMVECKAFLDAVASGTRPYSDAAEGIRVLKVLSACQQSITKNTPLVLEKDTCSGLPFRSSLRRS